MNQHPHPERERGRILAVLRNAPQGIRISELTAELDFPPKKSLHQRLSRLLDAGAIVRRFDPTAAGRPAIFWHAEHSACAKAWQPAAATTTPASARSRLHGPVAPARQTPPYSPPRVVHRLVNGRSVPVTICPSPQPDPPPPQLFGALGIGRYLVRDTVTQRRLGGDRP